MKVITLTPQQFDTFMLTSINSNPWQTSSYGEIMSKFNYEVYYIGFEESGILVGASLMLARNVYMGFKHFYAPRGIITNYDDLKTLTTIIEELKKYIFKQKGLVYTFDPFIIKHLRDRKGNIIASNNHADSIIETIKKNRVEFKGDWIYFEGIQPRFYAAVPTPTTPEKLFKSLSKQIRNKLRKSVKFGIEIFQDETKDIDEMFKLHGKFTKRPIEYYRELKNSFKNDLEIYYAKINTAKYVYSSKILYEKAIDEADTLNNIIQDEGYKGRNMRSILNRKMEMDKVLSCYKAHLLRATDLLKNNPDGIIIGLTIVLKHKKSIYIFEDSFLKEYGNLSPVHLLRWKIIEKYCQTASHINIGAVTGEFNKAENKFRGINEVRLNYGSVAAEYVGEFSHIVNKPIFSLYNADRVTFRI